MVSLLVSSFLLVLANPEQIRKGFLHAADVVVVGVAQGM